MKISLFIKSYTLKAYTLALLIPLIASVPTQANAGFFNDLVSSVIGQNIQASDEVNADQFGTDDFGYNSQNMQILGTASVDPNTKNVGVGSNVTIVEEGALLPDESHFGSGLESVSTGEMTTYEVQKGDTLSEIAEMYDISTNTIRWENNITGQNIKVGQKLNILPVTGVKHIVKKGDSVGKIATKYDAEAEDIYIFNDISSDATLKQGDIIFVPNGIIKAVAVINTPSKGSSPSPSTSSSNTKATSGYYLRPVSGRVTSPYGSRRGGFHYGIDFGASRGTPISASASGVVVKAITGCTEGRTSCGGRYGNYVIIQHSNGTRTFYAHLQKVMISVGQTVSQGDQIGTVGNTGRSTGPHLHFEIENANGSKMRPTF